MNYKDYYKKTEAIKIHEELFHNSQEYKYYILGIAQAYSWIYEIFGQYKNDAPFSAEYIQKTISGVIDMQDDELTKKYFKRLIENK